MMFKSDLHADSKRYLKYNAHPRGGWTGKWTVRSGFWAQVGRGKGGGEASDAEQAPKGVGGFLEAPPLRC